MTDIERMMKFVEPVTESGCWIWTGHLQPNGYGQFRFKGKAQYAHRASFELARGDIANGVDLDHLCRVRCCVNPDHLEPVSRKENLLRGTGSKLIGKRECIRGHDLSTNLFFAGSKKTPRCRECARIRDRARWARKATLRASSQHIVKR